MKPPDHKTLFAFLILFCTVITSLLGQTNSNPGWFWVADPIERGHGLPSGISRTVDTNGNVEYIEDYVTTRAYQKEATKLMLLEANQVAKALNLDEDLPITRTNIQADITPFDFFYRQGGVGIVTTTNYTYQSMNSGKLDHVEIDHSYEVWLGYQDQLLPASKVDNAGAYQLATQWLAALSVDVKALNRDCHLDVGSSPVLNYVGSGKKPIRRMFAPTYNVSWRSSNGPVAYVQLYLPDKVLIQLSIDDPKYNLRPPVTFTNLEALFPFKGKITTNFPVTPTYIDAGQLYGGSGQQEVTFVTDSNQPEPAFHDLVLSQWIATQTKLNTNHLSLSQLMTLKPVSGPDDWGQVTFDLPVRFDELHSDAFPNGTINIGSFDSEGNFIEYSFYVCGKAPDGGARLTWNINYHSPGRHEVRARLIYANGMDGDQFNLIGPPLSFWSSNVCKFNEDSTLFTSDGSDLYAKLREPAAKFHVIIHSLKGRLVNDISSSTTNGEINLAWNLIGLDGNKYTNNSFIGEFYVTYPDDTRTNPPVKAQFNKIGTSGDE